MKRHHYWHLIIFSIAVVCCSSTPNRSTGEFAWEGIRVSRHSSRRPTPVNTEDRHPGWRRVRASTTDTVAPVRSSSSLASDTSEKEVKVKEEAFLDAIDDISRGSRCMPQYSSNNNNNNNQKDVTSGDARHVFLPKELDSVEEVASSQWKLNHILTANRVALLASILSHYKPETDNFKMLRNSMDQLVRLDHNFFRVRMAWTRQPEDMKIRLLADYFVYLERKRRLSTESYNRSFSLQEPWLQLPKDGKKNQYLHRLLREGAVHISTTTFSRDELNFAEWTPVYFSCELRKWLISYTALVVSDSEQSPGSNLYSLRGVISIDMDVSQTDFDQCEDTLEDMSGSVPIRGTHKCDRESSRVSIQCTENRQTVSLFSFSHSHHDTRHSCLSCPLPLLLFSFSLSPHDLQPFLLLANCVLRITKQAQDSPSH